MDNKGVAAIFFEVADILDLQGVTFKPIAYRRAARSIESLEEDLSKVASEGKLEEIPGVGKSVAKKIEEILKTGQLSYLNKIRTQIPAGLLELLSVPDVGPKTASSLFTELGISNLEQLKQAAEAHKLRNLKGFGEKTEERILQGIKTLESKGRRILLGEAYPVAEAYIDYLRLYAPAEFVSAAGSLRRGKETVGDIDILVGDDKPAGIMDAFVSYPEVKDVLMKGPTKSSIVLKNNLQVDIRCVETKSYGAALQYFTGSKDHNVSMRRIGVDLGYKLNEYGVYERDSGEMVAGATEEEVYKILGLPWIPPEMREDNGEIDAARKGSLPALVEEGDVKGDIHVHTDWSDGFNSIKEVISSALSRGYQYVAITDHSQSLKIANGLSPEKLRKQVEAARKADEEFAGRIKVLAGCEVDIKSDGTLDYPAQLLEELDIAIGSIHSRFRMDRAEMTKRMVAAIESGRIDILGHPTGRLIGERDPYEFDFDKVFEAARDSSVCLEVNCFPNRLDLRDAHCRLAKEAGVKVALGTDSHRIDQMGYLRLGVITARRGWLEDGNVLNTLSAKELVAHLKRRRR